MKRSDLQNRAPQRTSARVGRIRERIFERLLLTPPRTTVTGYQLAALVDCTPAYAYAFLNRLEGLGLVARGSVARPGDLLRLWLSVREAPKPVDFSVNNPEVLLLPRPPGKYAATTYLAESRRHHYLMPARWDLYIREDDREAWMRGCLAVGGLRGRGNVRLLLGDPWVAENPFDELAPAGERRAGDPTHLVSDARLVVDLVAEGGVGVEAAQLIMEKRGWSARTRMRRRS